MKVSALQEKMKILGNLGKPLEFTEWELLVSSFWTSVSIFPLSPAESAQELFCITVLFPYQEDEESDTLK